MLATLNINYSKLEGKELNLLKVKSIEYLLSDVLELNNALEVRFKLRDIENNFQQNPSVINGLRLGIIYYKTALYLSFFAKVKFEGYALKSYNILSELYKKPNLETEIYIFIVSYRAAALALESAEKKKIKLLMQAFFLLNNAVNKYAIISYLPEFLRGSVAQNLPWFYFTKRKIAKQDFQSIIEKYNKNPEYANNSVMSFTYLAWAKQHLHSKKHSLQVLTYLNNAISLDKNYTSGRKKAEELKANIIINLMPV